MPIQYQYFRQIFSGKLAGPFAVGSNIWQAYVSSGDWTAERPLIDDPNRGQNYGDPAHLGDGFGGGLIDNPPQNIPPLNIPPVLNPQPAGQLPIEPDGNPNRPGCYVWERFISVSAGPNTQYIAYLGTPEWDAVSADNGWIPSMRGNTPRNPPYYTSRNFTQFWPPNSAQEFTCDIGGKPLSVPQSPDTRGYYCDTAGDSFTLAGHEPINTACQKQQQPPGTPPIVPTPEPGKSCGFYDCPSNTVGGECCHDYTPVFTAIQKSIQYIADSLNKQTGDLCDISDECVQKIYDKIWAKLTSVKKTCQQCCGHVSGGLLATSEEAFICSQMACECAETHCGPIESGGDGTLCEQQVWHAYCNQLTGQYLVTQSTIDIDQSLTFLGEYDTESDAREAAARECRGQQLPREVEVPLVSSPPPSQLVSNLCDISIFASQSGIDSYAAGINGTVLETYASDIILNTMRQTEQSLGWIPLVGTLVGAIEGASLSKIALSKGLAPQAAGLIGCGNSEIATLTSGIAAAATIQEYTGISMSEFAPHLAYALHASCRNTQMNPGEALSYYLAHDSSWAEVDTHFAIAGYCPGIAEKQRDVMRKKLSPLDLAILRHREKLTPSEYNQRIRELGYIHGSDADEIYELTNVVPPPSDIIRMMVRDADDEKLAARIGSDDEFDKKYQLQLRRWAADQGIPDRYMQYLWRSHWSIPSPGQLFAFNHRLRHSPQFNGDGQLFSKIRDALVQQDILPFWIPYLVETSFHPLTRVDTRRAFNIGAMDEKAVLKSYWDQGYSDENADILLRFTVKLRDQAAIGHKAVKLWLKMAITRVKAEQAMLADGLPQNVVTDAMDAASVGFASSWPVKAFTSGDMNANDAAAKLKDFGVSADKVAAIIQAAAPSVRRNNALVPFAAGTIDRATALGQMTVYGMSPDRSNRMLDRIELALEAKQALACQNAIKQRFLLGELDDAGVIKALANNGIAKERTNKLLGGWKCEKSDIGRAVPGQTLCEWLAQGVLNPKDFIQRLTSIGYRPDDAIQMFADCQGKISQRQAMQALKDAKAQAAALRKQQQAAKKAEAQLEREQKQLEANIAKGNATRKRRQVAIARAAEKLYPKAGEDLYTTITAVNNANARLIDNYALTPDQAIEALLRGAETFPEGPLSSYDDFVNTFAQGMVDKELAADEETSDGS